MLRDSSLLKSSLHLTLDIGSVDKKNSLKQRFKSVRISASRNRERLIIIGGRENLFSEFNVIFNDYFTTDARLIAWPAHECPFFSQA